MNMKILSIMDMVMKVMRIMIIMVLILGSGLILMGLQAIEIIMMKLKKGGFKILLILLNNMKIEKERY